MKIIDKLILLTFPFMEVGFTVGGLPIRIGELVLVLSVLRVMNSSSAIKIKKVNKLGLSIVTLLFFNLLLSFTITIFSEVDYTFFSKYILRNFYYIIVVISFLLIPLKFNSFKIDSYIKYILYLITVFYIIEFIDFFIINLNWQELVFVSRQKKYLFKEFFIRFAGQSSEPGYIIPLLSIPLIYGVFKNKFKYALVAILYILLTFSSFGYAVLVFALAFFIKNIGDQKLKEKVQNFLVKLLTLIPIVCLVLYNKVQEIFLHNWVKFETYFGLGNAKEWSASQRTGHMELAINLFKDSSWFGKLFGNGTGYYSKMSKVFTKYYIDDGEEAHNLYISTLTDRGLLGLFVLFLLFYFISKIKISDNASEIMKSFFIAVKFGAYVRMFHWLFTGMLWQYYFWLEVALLMSLSVYYLKNSDDRI